MPTVIKEHDPKDAKQKMLEYLDELARKVTTGEVCGLVVLATCVDGCVLTRCSGETLPPLGVLILQEIANEARSIFLDEYNRPDDGRPRLRAAGEEEDENDGQDDGGDGGLAS